MVECHEDEYDALARQLHESIADGQSMALTAKALRLLATPAEPAGLDEAWAAAEAAVGGRLALIGPFPDPPPGSIRTKAARAERARYRGRYLAESLSGAVTFTEYEGDTPAEALRALRARLLEAPR